VVNVNVNGLLEAPVLSRGLYLLGFRKPETGLSRIKIFWFTMASESSIKSQVKILGSSDPSLPPLALQVTQMVETYMLWIGTVDTDVGDSGEKAVLNGSLCKDWACAMPPRIVGHLYGIDEIGEY